MNGESEEVIKQIHELQIHSNTKITLYHGKLYLYSDLKHINSDHGHFVFIYIHILMQTDADIEIK